ncbi:hypothetical protein DL96DRAFT_600878 [Flagelloscypha sp. PMI_526]|nr:hypothetical protein DL96DRAFT_600878 [Flagelloscypha sp. PMI_526]
MSSPSVGSMVNVVGPVWFGHFFHNILFGMLTVQVYLYYVFFPMDQKWIKILVYSVFIIEVAQTAMRAYDMYNVEVIHWGIKSYVGHTILSWFATPILTAMSGGIVQIYFGYRIYVFSKKIWVPMFVWLLALVQVGSGISVGIIGKIQGSGGGGANSHGAAGNVSVTQAVTTWLVSTAITDISIAGLLTFYLYSMRSGIEESDRLVTRIIRLTVETGSLTALSAILILVLFYKKPPWNLIFADIIGKLYANNLMIIFNRRHFLANGTISQPLPHLSNTTTASGRIHSGIEFSSKNPDSTLGLSNKTHSQKTWELSHRGKDSII